MKEEELLSLVKSLGAANAAVIDASLVKTDRAYRDACAANRCGKYGRCWMCPPDVGEFEKLGEGLKQFRRVLVWQTIGQLEDSFDFESMTEAGERHAALALDLRRACNEAGLAGALHLGVGGCGGCKVCAKVNGEPCRHPELAMPSVEGYGIAVSELAKSAGMKYINGQNTVTYFGAVFFDRVSEG